MSRVFVGVGSNIDPAKNVPRALALLAERVRVVRVSPFYRSAPVGTDEGDDFWNGVLEAETTLTPARLRDDVLRDVERALGRRRTGNKNAPRTIDLDVLLHDDRVDPDFPLPDPGVMAYPFVAVPLLDLAPDLVVPGAGVPLRDVVAQLDASTLAPLPRETHG